MSDKMKTLVVARHPTTILKNEDSGAIHVSKFNEESLVKFNDSISIAEANIEIEVIPVFIDSYGGQVHSLIGMIEIIKACSKPVATIALGKAMSCGAMLLACGTKGFRFSSANCDIMLHEISSSSAGKLEDIKVDVEQTAKLNEYLFRLVQDASNVKVKNYFKKEYAKRANTDWYLNPKEFKKLGLIDHIGIPKLVKA